MHHASIIWLRPGSINFASVICIMHQYGSVLCTMTQCSASMAHWYASGTSVWPNAACVSGINMAQCCALGIKYNYSSMLCIRHQCGFTSYINMAQCWCIHGSKMCIRHQYRLMLCIRHENCSSMLCIMHQYGSMHVHPRLNDVHNFLHQASVWLTVVHQAYLWHSIAQCCAGINLWPDAVHQASQYSSNLFIVIQYG